MTRLKITRGHRRQGFTMVELLVVIGLILFLMSISIVALNSALGLARQRATQATILKVHGLMQQRVDAFNRAMDRTNLEPNIAKIVKDLGVTTRRSQDEKVYQILARKQVFQTRFPQNFSEHNVTLSQPYAAKHRRDTESAALLYWLLTSSEVFGIAPVDESEFSSNEVRDTDGDGLLEFVDGWGRPLRFYRWPTQLFRPGTSSSPAGVNGTSTPIQLAPINRIYAQVIWQGLPAITATGNGLDPLNHDPDDPTGQLMRFVNNVPANQTVAAMTMLQNRFHTPDTYHAFLIMSVGPDGVSGLLEPCDPIPDNNGLLSTTPSLGTTPGQGRLGAPSIYAAVADHPINDNLSNRKR